MDNGNITRKLIRSNIDGTIYDDILLYYDTTWPDRLVEYNGKRIDYDTDSIGCPHHYGIFVNGIFTSGITYSWRCSKLIGLNDSINNKTISYDYDEGKVTSSGIMSLVMRIIYCFFNNPIFLICVLIASEAFE